jgi:hypothetical protein
MPVRPVEASTNSFTIASSVKSFNTLVDVLKTYLERAKETMVTTSVYPEGIISA